jgi:hypothetical protein
MSSGPAVVPGAPEETRSLGDEPERRIARLTTERPDPLDDKDQGQIED